MWERLKSHPLLAGGVIIVGLLIFVFFNRSAPVSGGAPASDVATGDALQMAQLQAQTIGQQTAAAVQAQAENNAASLEALKLKYAFQTGANDVAANIASQQINAGLQETTTHDTLSASVANATLKRDTDLASINSNTTIQTTQALSSALVSQAQIASQTSIAAINAQQNSSCWFFC